VATGFLDPGEKKEVRKIARISTEMQKRGSGFRPPLYSSYERYLSVTGDT
jgi:hypothetical protein